MSALETRDECDGWAQKLTVGSGKDGDSAQNLGTGFKSELEIETGKSKLQITVSIGLASLSSGDTGASWLARADAALYEAKGSGRNCVRVARESACAVASPVPPRSMVPGPRSLPSGR